MPRRLICAIVGRRVLDPDRDSATPEFATRAGRCAAQAGFAVLTGGKEGAMWYAAQSAKAAGGRTLAILPNNTHNAAVGDFYDYVLPTPIGIVRNVFTASACDVMIAVPGGSGTLEEILFAQDFGRPVIQFPGWLSINTLTVEACHTAEGLSAWLAVHYERLRET